MYLFIWGVCLLKSRAVKRCSKLNTVDFFFDACRCPRVVLKDGLTFPRGYIDESESFRAFSETDARNDPEQANL